MRRTPVLLAVAAMAVGAIAVALSIPQASHSSTTASASPTASAPSTGPQAKLGYDQVRKTLAALPIKGRAPKTGYSRAQFGPAWTDKNTAADGNNGCDTRNDVLALQLQQVVRRTDNCTVIAGLLPDPYTGKMITFARGVCQETTPHPPCSDDVQIDHVVPESDAWQTGAQYPDLKPADALAKRTNFANDPDNLIATDGPTNASKGDSDAATWVPPVVGFRCTYVAKQVLVKDRYHLWVTPPEHDAMVKYLASC